MRSKVSHSVGRQTLRLAVAAALLSIGLAAGVASAEAIHAGTLKSDDRVAVLGDSITEQKNYSVILEEYLLMCQPVTGAQTVQFGWSGETTWGFKGRLKQDVLWFKPTVATVCYGMNDGGYAPLDPNRLKDYTQSTIDIVKQLKAGGVRLIVLTGPGPVDTDAFRRDNISPEEYNKTLAALNKAAGEIAKQEGVAFADLHTVMSQGMARFKQKHPGVPIAGPDGVHPDNNGHLVMAYAILKALGCDGNLGAVTVDMKANTATAQGGHTVLSDKEGVVEVQSTRYPFLYANGPDDARGQQAGLDAVPFNDDLNRFMLIVKNAPAGRVRVTWGTASKEFDAAELTKGINLAAEFMADNPFREPFARVERAVRAQQEFETPLTKQWLHDQPRYQNASPELAKAWDKVAQGGIEVDRLLREDAAKAVVPVKHTIKIEPVK